MHTKLLRLARLALAAAMLLPPMARAQSAPPTPPIEGSVTSLELVRDGAGLRLLIGTRPETDAATKPAQPPPGALRHLLLEPPYEKWSTPTRVDSPGQSVAKLSRGSDARLIADGATLTAVWTLPGNGAMGTGPLAVARSSDGGKTWAACEPYGPITDAGESASSKHGFRFPALARFAGKTHLVWIDALDESRRLGHAVSSDGGKTWSAPTLIDTEICACCPNSMAATPTALYALYRNKQPSDMGLAHLRDVAAFSVTPSVEQFGWEFDGCPHVGGTVIATPRPGRPDALVCATWTGKAGQSGVHVTRSDDGGATWSAPMRVSATDGSRTMDLASIDGQRLALAWDELLGTRRVILASTSRDGGATWDPPTRLSAGEGDGNSTHPRVAPAGDAFIVAWTQAPAATSQNLRLELRWLRP